MYTILSSISIITFLIKKREKMYAINQINSEKSQGESGGNVGGSAAGAAISAAANYGMAVKQNEWNKEYAEQQNAYNRIAMNRQFQLQKEMWDYTNWENQVKHLKAAGLNPALMYSKGGSGGTTGSVSAPSAGLPHSADLSHVVGNSINSIGMMLQLKKLNSEIQVNESIAEQNKANAELTKGAKTEQTVASTEQLKASTELIGKQTQSEVIKQEGYSLANDFNKISNEIASKTKDVNINRIEYLSTEAGYSMNKTLGEMRSALAKGKVDQASIDTFIKQYEENVKKTMADILVAKSQNQVNKERANEIVNDITVKWKQLTVNKQNSQTEIDKMFNQLRITDLNNNAMMDKAEMDGWFRIFGNLVGGMSGAPIQTPANKVGF